VKTNPEPHRPPQGACCKFPAATPLSPWGLCGFSSCRVIADSPGLFFCRFPAIPRSKTRRVMDLPIVRCFQDFESRQVPPALSAAAPNTDGPLFATRPISPRPLAGQAVTRLAAFADPISGPGAYGGALKSSRRNFLHRPSSPVSGVRVRGGPTNWCECTDANQRPPGDPAHAIPRAQFKTRPPFFSSQRKGAGLNNPPPPVRGPATPGFVVSNPGRKGVPALHRAAGFNAWLLWIFFLSAWPAIAMVKKEKTKGHNFAQRVLFCGNPRAPSESALAPP